MPFYAHTAEDANGQPLPESSGQWQPLADHLKNVADLAARFAAPFGASDEARLAGFLPGILLSVPKACASSLIGVSLKGLELRHPLKSARSEPKPSPVKLSYPLIDIPKYRCPLSAHLISSPVQTASIANPAMA
ncbi:MAG: hypothetical protein Q8J74_08615 [Candidatus Didemnitutus sp.]|nr:hypothetical protein [Candidatus Didemnitutus sp.]